MRKLLFFLDGQNYVNLVTWVILQLLNFGQPLLKSNSFALLENKCFLSFSKCFFLTRALTTISKTIVQNP